MRMSAIVAIVLVLAGAAQADVWRYEVLAADGSNINTGGAIGAPIVAWNVNGTADVAVGGLTWQAAQPANVTVNNYGGGHYVEGPINGAAGRYSDSDLASMMEYAFRGQQVTLDFLVTSGVTTGKLYRLQVLTEVEDPSEVYCRLINLSTGDAYPPPDDWAKQKNRIWECIFTATENKLDMRFQGPGGWFPWMSGVLLQEIDSVPVRTWGGDFGGNWDDSGNWTGGSGPDGNDQTAVFGDAITSSRTVYTDLDVTVKRVEFNNANTYVVSGSGSVNLEADSGNASLDVDLGDHQFQAAVNLVSSADADVATGASLAFNNALNLGGNTLTVTGDGTVAINNQLTTGGGSVVGLGGTIAGGGKVGGDLTNTSATVAPGNSPGTLSVGGNFSQGAGGTLAIELAGTASGEFDVLAVTGTASLGGTLEITELYTPGGGDTWTILTAGGGITGSFDTITAGYQVALANGDTELVLSLSGALLPGDANGDGCVDDLDLTALAVNWQQATSDWDKGDFNGDGIVNDLDLTALAVNWQTGCGGVGGLAAAGVPEPCALGLLALGGVAVLRRRHARA